MGQITENTRQEVKDTVFQFFSEECEVDIQSLHEGTDIINDINGDSLMFLELIEIFKKKYNLNIELKIIGKYAVKHPVRTLGELINTQMLIIEHENDILDLEK
ncbi:MAG: acyl carrier protein [Bacteroidetes bacterium]|nr:acyl carrier protein [Bacteroidota bacterium]